MTNYLAGIHDREGRHIVPPGGYCVDTVALSDNPEPADYTALRADVNWIVRLNHAYGSGGTIPLPTEYPQFAQACADYVRKSNGARIFIIGNEPQHENERPNNVYITPEDYARCFAMCRNAIKSASQSARVVPAACAPYHADPVDWLVYWKTMLNAIAGNGGCDGLAVHAYTRSSNPEDIFSDEKMGPPLTNQYSGFRTYIDALDNVPPGMTHLPAYLTEFNELLTNGWDNHNTGVVQAAYREIDQWNDGDIPKVHCLVLYRWPRYDKWFIEGKQGVIDDFNEAVALGYQSPDTAPLPPPTQPTEPPTPTPPSPVPDREIDPVLAARGVEFDFVSPPAGTGYWRITYAEWLDEEEADAVGPDHHILGTVKVDGRKHANIPFLIRWPSGSTLIFSKPNDPNASYNYDFAMSASLNEFSIEADNAPSDKVSGIGMGAHGNPSIHTSTWIDFEWAIAETIKPPIPPEPEPAPPLKPPALLWPVDGPVTQYFGRHEIDYSAFGLPGHDGLDFGVPVGTPVRAVADGVVMYVSTDPMGFGLYIRIWHGDYGFHSFVAHLSEQLVDMGQSVKRGDIIAKSGNTGNSTGPHCHYSTRIGERNAYYDLHDGYQKGCANPLVVHALVNGRDPNLSLGAT